MKPTWRDYATILMAFTAVFLCGYGIGHLVGERKAPPAPIIDPGAAPAWKQETLQTLQQSLALRPEQAARVEQELTVTAQAIDQSNRDVVLDYHRHLDDLYKRLIALLDEEQAQKLREEKKDLEERIRLLSTE